MLIYEDENDPIIPDPDADDAGDNAGDTPPDDSTDKGEGTPDETPEQKETRERDERGRYIPKAPAETTPAIDPEKIKADAKAEAATETLDRVVKAIKGDESTTDEEKDRYENIAEQFVKENGRAPTWPELVKISTQHAKMEIYEEMEANQKKADEEKQKSEAETKEIQEARRKEVNDFIDEQLNDLYANKKLPPLKNADGTTNVYGKKVREQLFKTMQDVNIARTKENKRPIYDPKIIYYEHFKMPEQQPAGYDAPVSAGRGASHSDNQELDYVRDVMGKRLDDY